MIPHCPHCQLWTGLCDGGKVFVQNNNLRWIHLTAICPPEVENFKNELRTLKLLPSSLSVCMHFSVLELWDVCWDCWFALITFPVQWSCLPVLDVVLSDAVKSPWLCSKEPLTLFWELGWVVSGTYVCQDSSYDMAFFTSTSDTAYKEALPHFAHFKMNPILQRSYWDYFDLKGLLWRSSLKTSLLHNTE